MANNSWDDVKSSNSLADQDQQLRLGFGRGKRAPSTTTDKPFPTTTWNSGGSSESSNNFRENESKSNSRGAFGARQFSSGNSNFENRTQFGKSDSNSRPFMSGRDGNSRGCYNCNQLGHISRDCPEPKNESHRDGAFRSNRGGFQQSRTESGGFQQSRTESGGFQQSRTESGGFQQSRTESGGFQQSRTESGGFQQSRTESGGFHSGSGEDRNNNFQLSSNGPDSALSITVRNNDGRDGNNNTRTVGGWRGSNNDESSANKSLQFTNSSFRANSSNNQRESNFGGRSENRTDRNDFGRPGNKENNHFQQNNDRKPPDSGNFRSSGGSDRRRDHVSDDIFDQPGRSDQKPIERYIPPPPPTSEPDIFGTATERGTNFGKHQHATVRCTPSGSVKPIEVYDEADLGTPVLKNLRRAQFDEPTSIQQYTIPAIQDKHDIMACAQTGSGKTAAFLLPIISNLLKYHGDQLYETTSTPSPLCLIVSPTRELAVQTEREARKFAYETPIKACSVVGGHDMFAVSDQLRGGCHIVSATTGRLKDMVEKNRISLRKVKYFVLDEADRMLDTGFEPDIRKLEELGLPSKEERITSMFSATFPTQVQQLAKHFLRDNYVFLVVGAMGGANEDITQTIEEVPGAKKKDRLIQLLENNLNKERCLIFVEQKRSADYIGSLLSQKKFMSTTMHGDRSQAQRHQAVRDFTNGSCPILVATSVAARGLDFPLIGYVINFDLPDTSDFYIHRIGRTGRAGHLGKSISFFDPDRESDCRIAPELVHKLSEASQDVPDFLRRFTEGNSSGFSHGAPSARATDVRFRGTNFGSRSQGGQLSGGTASAGAATAEEWD